MDWSTRARSEQIRWELLAVAEKLRENDRDPLIEHLTEHALTLIAEALALLLAELIPTGPPVPPRATLR